MRQVKMAYPSQRQLLKQFSIKPKRSLGQNFVVKNEVLDRIASLCQLDEGDYVIEIGAGLGGLTIRLAAAARMVFAIEKDKRLAHILETHVIKSRNVKVIKQDAFLFDYRRAASVAGNPLTVVGNLPYNAASRLTMELLRMREPIKKLVLMYQKEVGDRITATPGSKEYGFLTVICNLYAAVKPLLTVSKEAFYPRPKVDSRLLEFSVIHTPRYQLENEQYFYDLVKACFSQRRKKLKNALRIIRGIPMAADVLMAALYDEHIDPHRRGETLSIDEFCRLSNRLFRELQEPEKKQGEGSVSRVTKCITRNS